MRLGTIAFFFLFIVGIVGISVHRLHAQELGPPDRMDALEAARLHADILQSQVTHEKLDPIDKRIEERAAHYHIGPHDTVDWDTGVITRASIETAQAVKK